MKIIIVGTAYPYRGGLAAFNERMALQFEQSGNSVEVVTFTLQYPDFLFPGKTQFSTEKQGNNLKIKRLINTVNPISWYKAYRYILNQKPDAVIFCYWMFFVAPAYNFIARKLRESGVKNYALVHNLKAHEGSFFDQKLAPKFVNNMDGFFTLSNSVANQIRELDATDKPIVCSPHPIYDIYGKSLNTQEARAQLELSNQGKYVLFFGFIRHYKGLDVLLDAMADARLEAMNVNLIIAGEFYEDEQKYLDKINALHLSNRIVLKSNYISNSEVAKYFCASDIVAQPYRTATQSGVTQIAYHFEIPMLVTKVGGLEEIVLHDKTGYCTDCNASQIADALVDFFEHDRKNEMMGYVHKEKHKYTWEAFEKKFEDLLLERVSN